MEQKSLKRDEFLQNAVARSNTKDPVQLTVRDLIAYWGARRRRERVADRIYTDLTNMGLATQPDFNAWGLDSNVVLVPLSSVTQPFDEDEGVEPDVSPDAYRLKVGNLPSSTSGVTSVAPDQDLQLATTRMIRHDYSQLAVMAGDHSLKGAVSWESIGRQLLRGSPKTVKDAMVDSEPVAFDADLLALVPRIVAAGYVFVKSTASLISGIVTTADLSEEFVELAQPFFLLGEIERICRRLVESVFDSDEIRLAASAQNDRKIETSADLTLGEVERLLQPQETWSRLGLRADRVEFLKELASVRDIRNEVMHFSPDPPDASDIDTLKGFLKLLRFATS